ncbi:IS30 family transposase, partial [Cryobacterium sp. N19]|uniref:IS30 family transposase n=1 Tax=Cryobacterium sp. N19 TaxID=2048288 RepID=UPI001124D33E
RNSQSAVESSHGRRAAIPSKPSRRQGDLSHTHRPRVAGTLLRLRHSQQRKEGDLIVGSASGSAIATLVERTTRFVVLVHLPNGHSATALLAVIVGALNLMPVMLRRSLTWDQGTELARHVEITKATGVPIFFCDPHSPWQRGTNENTNGLLRQYFPKGTHLNAHSAQRLLEVATELNERPRKTLNRSTPADLLSRLTSKKEITPVASTI